MDINELKKYIDSESLGHQIKKAISKFRNDLLDQEQGKDIVMSDYFKTLREPLIEQQKKTDEKQDDVVKQLKENQNKIVHYLGATEHQTPLSITEGEYEDEEDESQQPTTQKERETRFLNIEKKLTKEDKGLIKDLGYPPLTEAYKMNIDELNDFIEQTVNFSKKLGRHKVILNRKKDTKAVEIIDKENKYN